MNASDNRLETVAAKESLYLGLDLGAETIKMAMVAAGGSRPRLVSTRLIECDRHPARVLADVVDGLDLSTFCSGAVTGRMAALTTLRRVPTARALGEGFRLCHPGVPSATVLTIGSQGFSVLEWRDNERPVLRQNSRCAQGSGNFLSQLTGRLGLTVAEADLLCASVEQPARLSGRCPVILKTDLTHLANCGESHAALLAGLFDAVAENVETILRPGRCPPDVFLSGGVSRSKRIRRHLEAFLRERSLRLHLPEDETNLFYAAVGAAVEAIASPRSIAGILTAVSGADGFELTPPLRLSLAQVTVMPPTLLPATLPDVPAILGLDIGSTGSKAALVNAATGAVLWHCFRRTQGDPAGAARGLVEELLQAHGEAAHVIAFGVTDSGREIAARLLAASYGRERVIVRNEIAAHAAGALHHDPKVDTIFEIGGQDAKYIRLTDGRVSDMAMNGACSAGTGSFLEEQGTRVGGVTSLADLSRRALEADAGVSLGQHCSVFMAEIIESALADGKPAEAVMAGLYDSVVKNYLNRVKGPRSIGQRIFCQGMPFTAPALAAAVARQTGRSVIVPPEPGMTGAVGIALIARKAQDGRPTAPVSLPEFSNSRVAGRMTHVCNSTRGCGAPGNRCRIEHLKVDVGGRHEVSLWGGSCALHDRGFGGRAKLPNGAPDPFRERRQLMDRIIAQAAVPRGRPKIGMTPEFVLAGLFPFFVTWIRELGFDPVVPPLGNRQTLRRGQEEYGVPVCAPVQLYAGTIAALAADNPEFLLLPMLRHLPRRPGQTVSTLCPLTQASSDVLANLLPHRPATKLLRPVLDMGDGNLRSAAFHRSLQTFSRDMGVHDDEALQRAFARAVAVQDEFDAALQAFGAEALRFARERGLVAAVILGRDYTLHQPVLNAGLPAIVRELGALPVPVDCYPVPDAVPSVPRVYWGHGHENVRAAINVRDNDRHVAIYCSTYSCGPDSLVLPLCEHVLRDKPFCTIESDAHAGDAGTRTRIEAFLHCVDNHYGGTAHPCCSTATVLQPLTNPSITFADARRDGDLILIPRMGDSAVVLAAALRGDGYRAEALPVPDRDALGRGRAFTSGKECLPAIVTLGSLLQRIHAAPPDEHFVFFMPSANGPCRLGLYHLLHRLVLESLGEDRRTRLLSPHSSQYFNGITTNLALKIFAAFVASDALTIALLHVRPVEREPGSAQRLFDEMQRHVVAVLESTPAPRSISAALADCGGTLFGLLPLMQEAATRFATLVDPSKRVPTVALVGEIYVRLDTFSNDFIIAKLEERGLRVRLAPFTEWIEYVDTVNQQERRLRGERVLPRLKALVPPMVRRLVHDRLLRPVEKRLGCPPPPRVSEILRAAAPYLRRELLGEAVLTLGYPIVEHRRKLIAGAVSVGPFECMPNKIAETLFTSVRRDTRLPTLTLSLNGDPLDIQVLDAFAYEVKAGGR